MASGIRAEVKIDEPADCVVAQASAETSGRVHSVSKSTNPSAPERVTEEFMLEPTTDPDEIDVDADLSSSFSYGSSAIYRFERDLGCGCPCECIEAHDCPVTDVRTTGSALYLTFHAPDMHGLQAVIGELRERYATLDVQRLLRSQRDHTEQNLVFVDRSMLTDRQADVLETAHRMGYFEHPKRANAGDVADELGISGTTLTEHLAAAQTKLLNAILDND
ncbi:helix-turn-helix domain-containing protein [Natrinema sp. 74]|uniref:helix-turn-helix domain-containing protein n=1 Tax=Natrinema sp. 74 TaxID=3384159 RepID=UPI0038D3B27C